MRILTYPLGIVTALFCGHKEARKNVEEYFKERGDFAHLDEEIATNHAAIKAKFNGVIPRNEIGKLSAGYAAGKTRVLHESGFRNTLNYLKANTGAEKANVFVSALGAAAIVVGLGSFLSEKKSEAKGLQLGSTNGVIQR